MDFLRLSDGLLSVLFEDDDILAIDKSYGFNAHTNDAKLGQTDYIQDGLIEMFEKNFKKKLHIIHRLDQTTTGVMIFGKSAEAAKKYADFFFNREVQKTYWFLTKSKSTKTEFLIEDAIIHKGKELDAKTQLTLQKKAFGFELWKAKPFTGRNHQIRIHAKAAGLSILGDPKYGGAENSFLCLHNRRIEFPNGVVIESKPPVYFENLQLLEDPVLVKVLFEADRRERLFSTAVDVEQCYRLAHTPHFTMDRLGPVLWLNWYRDLWAEADEKRFTYFATLLRRPLLVRLPDKSQRLLQALDVPEFTDKTWVAKEGDTRYELRSEAGVSVGLFLNQRLQRRWVRQNAEGKAVLNLFAHTGVFSLAAALGKAREVTTVEGSKGGLSWAKRNFEINSIEPNPAFKFLCRDSLSFLLQAREKKLSYDLIICDAPTFLRREKGVFKIETDLEALLFACMGCLNPGGQLLFSTGFEAFFIDDIRKSILKIQKSLGLTWVNISCILPALDFELPDEKTDLKSFLITVNN